MLPRLTGFAVLAVLLVFAPMSVFGQEQGGSIQGVVKDSSGAVLPGVTVEARSPSVVGASTAITDSRGEYRFPALPAGTYEIKATLQGFGTKQIPETQLQLGQLLKIDITLQVAALSESVVVPEWCIGPGEMWPLWTRKIRKERWPSITDCSPRSNGCAVYGVFEFSGTVW